MTGAEDGQDIYRGQGKSNVERRCFFNTRLWISLEKTTKISYTLKFGSKIGSILVMTRD